MSSSRAGRNVTITQPLSFSAETTVASFDTYLHLYQTSFDPNAQLTNLVAGDDDGGAGLLSLINAASDGPFTPGQYIVVVSGFSNGSFGTYTLEINGAVLGFAGVLLDELEATAGTFARLSTRQSFGNTRSGAQNSFATRDLQSPLGFGGAAAARGARGAASGLKPPAPCPSQRAETNSPRQSPESAPLFASKA